MHLFVKKKNIVFDGHIDMFLHVNTAE